MSLATITATASCPLCGCLVRAIGRETLSAHLGRVLDATGTQRLLCDGSRRTLADAQRLAVREETELDALRLRAHP
jgi:hypothetical protein